MQQNSQQLFHRNTIAVHESDDILHTRCIRVSNEYIYDSTSGPTFDVAQNIFNCTQRIHDSCGSLLHSRLTEGTLCTGFISQHHVPYLKQMVVLKIFSEISGNK